MTVGASVDASPLASRRVRGWVGLLALEGLLLVAYFALTPDRTGPVRYLVYPFVWMNVGLWAVWRTTPTPGSGRHRLVGAGVAVSYLVALLAVPGNVALGTPGVPLDVRVGWYAPGWGPLVAVTSSWIRLFLVPFEVVGYAALSYLVYANVLDLTRGTLSGALGLVTCVGCTVPVLAPLVGLLGGPAASLTTTAYAFSYDVGTLVFVATVGLLYAAHEGALPWR